MCFCSDIEILVVCNNANHYSVGGDFIAIPLPDAVLNSLDAHIVVIDGKGQIHYVNQAWLDFAASNGSQIDDWLSVNYLSVCEATVAEDTDSARVLEGLHTVIQNQVPFFVYEYPCHAVKEQSWYLLRAVPLRDVPDRFVISHHNITRNKLVEQQAERLALEDPLTELYNRRGLSLEASEEFARAIRQQTEISVVWIDIDHFKFYNDFYGHQAGDHCLVQIAKVLRHHIRRPGDIIARVGGDEFLLILPSTPAPDAYQIVESIRQSIFDMNLILPGSDRITISAGITTSIPNRKDDFKQRAYQEADEALYKAKKIRNTICFFDDAQKALLP